ncbi:hypothetical protein COY25_02145 [Candidatus Uhrbacteria bacterium CG_4_10_14_0_2_um_filter_41_7]|uniref:Uncharacterized protein n=1 Tax=Candidatus Uhrbacteria bacterium CG_4_9_14_3_um_filter_41_35 TaxID=1975034 RepID=A0A2M7XF59_9BACT|nr:MAG: hypothetical protein COV92_00230 [Candidatus Uhrbacteria bacterium CG11_big_fil_rev_8_21_14_0_20_41_9]PIZ54456.1 MAG: hypothetical protein COY25_02145 [Candidatus Uhrbacteria bacterium CG_4_10_14_0_2_um_filter_41_7]PJA46514.1 MAG: hypothetical protein CO173_01990 [Candidatus Uhrbacteria bacterium CG_4_9_14_3_um_filter_41_35]
MANVQNNDVIVQNEASSGTTSEKSLESNLVDPEKLKTLQDEMTSLRGELEGVLRANSDLEEMVAMAESELGR